MESKLHRLGKRAFLELSLAIDMVVDMLTGPSFWLVMLCSFGGMYVFVMLYAAYLLHVNPWLTIVPPLIPVTTAWFLILRKRIKNYLALLLQPPRNWDIDEAVKGYEELLRKQRNSKQKNRKRASARTKA